MHEVFSILGAERIFWRVGMKPGAAVLTGRCGKTMIFALSGNPYASYVDLHMIVRPALSEFTGNNRLEMIRGTAVLMDDFDKKSPVRRFIRATVQDGRVYIDGHTGGNGDISSGRNINAMVDVPAGSDKLSAGSGYKILKTLEKLRVRTADAAEAGLDDRLFTNINNMDDYGSLQTDTRR